MADYNLPANLDLNNHKDLPGLVKHGIRSNFITTPERQTLRIIARLVDNARALALPDEDLLVVLASAVIKDRANGFAPDWHPYYFAIYELAWSMYSSPIGLKDTLLRTVGRATLADHITVIKEFVALETAKRAMPAAEAQKIISGVIDELKPLYPELDLSYGYVGNIYWGPRRDDRSFQIFTKLRDRHGYSVSFGSHSYDRLADLAFQVRAQLADWCGLQSRRLASGDVFRIAQAA